MEVEVKYAVPSSEVIDRIWNDRTIINISDPATLEKVPLFAVYYDTEDKSLRKRHYTIRARSEGPAAFATVKWGGSSSGAMHKREEINIPIDPQKIIEAPSVDLFAGSAAYKDLKELTDGKPLVPVLVMRFTRSRMRLTFEGNIIELALDLGNIETANGSTPICEMELEHFAGPNENSVKKLGDHIAEKYSLRPEPRSKYSRGLALLDQDHL